MKILKSLNFIIILLVLTTSCGFYEKVDQRQMPDGAKAKARKNVDEGRGMSIGGLLKKNMNKGEFEFSTSNSIWRASLDTLDFIPLTTVDYSGGMIITDWYSDNNQKNQSIKITLRFLSNEIKSNSLKINVHQKTCSANLKCSTILLEESQIKNELRTVILRKAAQFEKNKKKK